MTFIIAEVGSNWTSLEDCYDSIVSAKECGADAVKFQMYTHKELYGYDLEWRTVTATGLGGQSPKIETVSSIHEMPGTLPRDWIPLLHAKCQEVGIEFMCTAFSPEGYRFIDPYVKRHKIASAENTDLTILDVVQYLGKPVLMSTGGSSLQQIEDSLAYLVSSKELDVTLMYCVSAYPAKNVDLRSIPELRYALRLEQIGYSCHSDDWLTPVIASRLCCLDAVEKHFKIRDMDTPDNPHSILPEDFRKMVSAIRYGLEPAFPDPQEADFIAYSKRRWIPDLNGYFRTKKP